MDDDPLCQGCGIPLSEDQTYACDDCYHLWAMTGYDVERSRGDENPEPSEL